MEEISSTQQKSEERDIPPSSIIEFRNRYYKEISDEQWQDWKWQIKNSIRTKDELLKFTDLSKEENEFFESEENKKFKFRVTPFYLAVTLNNKLRKCVIPTSNEFIISNDELSDPLHEDDYLKTSNLVHKYLNRCLFITTTFCPMNCRFCTRSRMVGEKEIYSLQNWNDSFNYLKEHKEINDLLFSGGEVLSLLDSSIEYLLNEARKINHIKTIRIGTKILVTNPARITSNLINIFKKYNLQYINIHFTRAEELTEETLKACKMLTDAGIVLGSQTVLLKNVNNDVESLKNLFEKLVENKIRPYYLYDADYVQGSNYFRVSIDNGKEIMNQLRKITSGLCMPTYVQDSVRGKVPVDLGF
jgi:lysine 2,3-aminomutase